MEGKLWTNVEFFNGTCFIGKMMPSPVVLPFLSSYENSTFMDVGSRMLSQEHNTEHKHIKAGVDRGSFQTKNQMVFVKKTHCKMWLCFDMVGHRRVIKGYQYKANNAYS